MVRPVTPDRSIPNSPVEVDGSENSRSDQNDNPAPADSLLEEAALQARFGLGFSLRQTSSRSNHQESGIAEDGASLYRGFLSDQFRRRNIPEPSELFLRDSSYNRNQQSSSSELLQAGSQLRILSEEFAQSPMRQWVEDQAAQVPLETLDFNAFSDLLYGLFQEGGVTWERVVVLFYFCADLAVRAFRETLPRQFHNIVDWSFRFFSGEQMMRWVADHGGWAKVMQKSADSAYKIARIGFFVMGMLAFAAYIWKNR